MAEQERRPSRGGAGRDRASVGAGPQRPRGDRPRDARPHDAGRGGASGRTPDRTGDDRPRPRRVEPELPDEVTGEELDVEVRRDLSVLSRDNAIAVARHLVVAGVLMDENPELALEHARAASGRAGRLASVREATGLAAYAAHHPDEALRELRTARRLSGDPSHLPVMADCERALGRPERALDLATSPEAASLSAAVAAEMRIVASGARADLGQLDAAVLELRTADLAATRPQPWHARTFVAHAEALRAAGRAAEAPAWEARARHVDPRNTTEAFPPPTGDGDDVVLLDVEPEPEHRDQAPGADALPERTTP